MPPIKAGTAYVAVQGDFSPLGKQLKVRGGVLARQSTKIGLAVGGAIAAGVGVAAAKGIKRSLDDAVNLGEQVNKTRVVFRGSEKTILKWSKTTAAALGVSRREALEATGVFGNMLVPMGLARDEAGKMSKRMVGLAADMASFNNASPQETLDALRAGLAGETEPLRRFGVFLNAARVEQEAINLGLKQGKGELTAAAKAQATYSLILKDSKDAQGDFGKTSGSLANQQRIIRAEIEDTSAAIGQAFVPSAQKVAQILSRDVLPTLQKTGEQVGRTFARDDLTLDEKVQRAANIVKRDLGPTITSIGEDLKDADIGGKLEQAVEFALPRVADAMARGGPRAAQAFANGFLDSGPLGRLVIGGVLLSKLGGLGAFRTMGALGGTAAGSGFAAAAGQGAAAGAPGFRAKAAGMFRSVGIAGAIAAGVAFGPELVKQIQAAMQKESPEFNLPKHQEVGGIGGPLNLVGPLLDQVNRLGESQNKLKDFGDTAEQTFKSLQKAGDTRGLAELAEQARALGRDFPETQAKLERFASEVEHSIGAVAVPEFRKLRRAGGKDLQQISQIAADASFEIMQSLGTNTARGKEALSRNMKLAAAAIRESMRKGTISARTGTAEIRRLMIASLQQFGFTPEQARNEIADHGRGRFDAGREEGATGHPGLVTKQRGGFINVGKPAGDSVPALLERGEFVLNRKAVKKIGVGALHRLNFSDAPRFQKGGLVSGDTDYGSALSRALNALARATGRAIFVSSGGRSLGEQAALVRQKGAWSPNNPGAAAATPNAPHVAGIAADIRPGREAFAAMASRFGLGFPVPNEPWHVQLMNAAAAAGATSAPKLKRVLFTKGLGAVSALGQRGLDRVRAGAQARLADLVSASAGAGDGPGGGSSGLTSAGGSFNKRRLMALWNTVNPGLGDPNLMAAIALAESGGRPSIVNSIGAGGLWQIYPPEPGYLDPTTNARIAGRKLRSQGLSAWEVFTKGTYTQFLQRGGVAGTRRRLGRAERLATPAAALKRTLGALRTGKTARVRGQAIKSLTEKIKAIGLPASLSKRVGQLGGDSNVFGEYAQRAGTLTDESAIGEALQAELEQRTDAGRAFPDGDQAELVDGMLGRVNGRTQLEWLSEQLGALFNWRNAMIQAQEIVQRRREEIAQLIEQARARLAQVVERIREQMEERHRIERTLKGVRSRIAKTKKNPALVKTLRSRAKDLQEAIGVIDREVKPRERERDQIKDRILPALTGRRETLNETRSDLSSNLQEVQGIGSSMMVLPVLPDMGALGGRILDVQSSIHDLTTRPPRVTADTTKPEDKGEDPLLREQLELVKQMLRDETRSKLLSESQFKTIRDFGPLPSFGGGGIVPGPAGTAQVVEAHGGEGVFTRDQMAAIGGPAPVIVVQVLDGAVREDRIRVVAGQEAERVTRRAARFARPLPGHAGALGR